MQDAFQINFWNDIPFCKLKQHETLEESTVSWEGTMVLSKEEYIHFGVNLRDFFSCMFLSVPNTFTLEAPVRILPFTREGDSTVTNLMTILKITLYLQPQIINTMWNIFSVASQA